MVGIVFFHLKDSVLLRGIVQLKISINTETYAVPQTEKVTKLNLLKPEFAF